MSPFLFIRAVDDFQHVLEIETSDRWQSNTVARQVCKAAPLAFIRTVSVNLANEEMDLIMIPMENSGLTTDLNISARSQY